MGDNSAIEWTKHTFNPWWGCAHVSPGCRFCYAERDARRYGHDVWGKHGPRRMLSEDNWAKPLRWNREEPRKRLWLLIEATSWLRWQLLTKRPENVAEMVPWGEQWPPHVWLGTSVEDQQRADERIPELLKIAASVRFLSCEPLLGPVDLSRWTDRRARGDGKWLCVACCNEPLCPKHTYRPDGCSACSGIGAAPGIDWCIVGGESGSGARPMDLAWARDLLRQCRAAGVAPFVKQLGAHPYDSGNGNLPWLCRSAKGGDPGEWPTDLRAREFPR